MTRRAPTPQGLVIPWPLVAVIATVLLAVVGGTVAINVQIASMKERVDILYAIEMERFPRQGPRATEAPQ